jgi:hypothetical protein
LETPNHLDYHARSVAASTVSDDGTSPLININKPNWINTLHGINNNIELHYSTKHTEWVTCAQGLFPLLAPLATSELSYGFRKSSFAAASSP